MRNIHRSAAAVILVLALAVPAEGASRSSRSSFGIWQSLKRFVILVTSRVSPPGGYQEPAPAPEPPPEPTEATVE